MGQVGNMSIFNAKLLFFFLLTGLKTKDRLKIKDEKKIKRDYLLSTEMST